MELSKKLVFLLFISFWTIVTILNLIIEFFKNWRTFFKTKKYTKPNVLNGWNHRYAHLSDVKLHYVEDGNASKPLIVMIHGFPEFWYSWRYQIKYFKDNYHVVAVDMRGYNKSSKPEGVENYRPPIVANDIKELINFLNYEKAILIGHDWGAAIAWRVAAVCPELVEKLIVLNCPHPSVFGSLIKTNLQQQIKSWYMFMFQTPWLPEFVWRVNDFKMLKTVLRGEKSGIKCKEMFTDDDEQAWLYTYSKPAPLTGPINFYRAAFRDVDNKLPLQQPIKARTLIIWGTDDAFIEISSAQMSKQYCESCDIRYVDGASHWVQQDNPDIVNAYIKEFLIDN